MAVVGTEVDGVARAVRVARPAAGAAPAGLAAVAVAEAGVGRAGAAKWDFGLH